MKDLNQQVADRLHQMDLSERAELIIAETEIRCMAEVFGACETAEDVEQIVAEYFDDEEDPETIKEIREYSGLSQQKFANRYNIPLRTVQNWEGEVNEPPTYLIQLLWRAVKEDFSRGE